MIYQDCQCCFPYWHCCGNVIIATGYWLGKQACRDACKLQVLLHQLEIIINLSRQTLSFIKQWTSTWARLYVLMFSLLSSRRSMLMATIWVDSTVGTTFMLAASSSGWWWRMCALSAKTPHWRPESGQRPVRDAHVLCSFDRKIILPIHITVFFFVGKNFAIHHRLVKELEKKIE